MKIKNISLSFFILASLIVSSFAFYVGAENTNSRSIFQDGDSDGLSNEEEKTYGTDPTKADTDGDDYSDGAEVRSGYDPTKPAPGDSLSAPAGAVAGDTQKKNLTQSIAQEIGALTEKSATENKEISLDDLETILDPSLGSVGISEEELPEVKKEDLKIKSQNYAGLGKEKATAKKKEDALDYLTALTYIFTSNSPEPITKIPDVTKMFSLFSKTIITAITSQDASGLKDLLASQKKITEQLKAVAVPEDLVEIHIKALRFALYCEKLATLVEKNPEDPLGDIANLSKLDGFLSVFTDFMEEAQSKFAEYALSYDEATKKKLESYGLEAPADLSELQSLLNTSRD